MVGIKAWDERVSGAREEATAGSSSLEVDWGPLVTDRRVMVGKIQMPESLCLRIPHMHRIVLRGLLTLPQTHPKLSMAGVGTFPL